MQTKYKVWLHLEEVTVDDNGTVQDGKSLDDVFLPLDVGMYDSLEDAIASLVQIHNSHRMSKGVVIKYMLIGNDTNGRDEPIGIVDTIEKAKSWFDEYKKDAEYCRYESVEIIGYDKSSDPIYDNNNTIESYFAEDDEDLFTPEQHEQARAEGWDVFYTGIQDPVHNLYELQRVDEMDIFPSDVEAILHVMALADNQPDSLYGDAIRFLARKSPNEVDSILRDIYGKQTEKLLKKLNISL